MKRTFALLATTAALFAASPSTQAQDVSRIDGADLLIDLAKHAGHQVIIKNVDVFGASNSGALGNAGSVTVKITTTGIDPETFRYFLKNSSNSCVVRLLLATPTGEKSGSWPLLTGVKIVE